MCCVNVRNILQRVMRAMMHYHVYSLHLNPTLSFPSLLTISYLQKQHALVILMLLSKHWPHFSSKLQPG